MICRNGEKQKVRYRTERCFRVGQEWYIATREGRDVGPFNSRNAAENAVPRYLKLLKEARKSDIYASKIAIDGIWASTLYS